MKRWLWIPVVVILLVTLAIWRQGRSAPQPTATATPSATETPAPRVQVRTLLVQTRVLDQQQIAQGSIFPLRQATVSAVQGGVIRSMPLWKNRFVHAGEVLAELNLRDQQAQRDEAVALVHEAEVNLHNLQAGASPLALALAQKDLRATRSTLKNADATYRRRHTLYDQGGLALKDLQDSQLALSVARANEQLSQRSLQLLQGATNPGSLELARTKVQEARLRVATLSSPLSFATLCAPIDGTVIDQFQFLGEFVSPGTKLVAIADLTEVIVKAQFPDTVLAQLQVGDLAQVRPLDRPGVHLSGRVSVLGAVTDPTSRTGEVWVNLPNPGARLRSGGFCDVVVQTRAVRAAVVPVAAVTLATPQSTQGSVMVVDGAFVAHKRAVRCGIHQGSDVQVSGLRSGERVIVEGNYALADGTAVQEAP